MYYENNSCLRSIYIGNVCIWRSNGAAVGVVIRDLPPTAQIGIVAGNVEPSSPGTHLKTGNGRPDPYDRLTLMTASV